MKYLYLHLFGLLWCLTLFAAMSFKVYLERDYPYMDHPIEAVAFELLYYPNSHYPLHREIGSLEKKDSVFVLNSYRHLDSGLVQIRREQMENIQLNFSFIHQDSNSSSQFSPWRSANEGGLLLGTLVPVYLRHLDTDREMGPFQAISQAPHQFKFTWGFKEVADSLEPGSYALRLAINEADIPFHRRKQVEALFSPNFFPNYIIYLEVPEYPWR